MKQIRTFLLSETGATAIEYALIAGMISIAIVAGATLLGGNLGDRFTMVADSFK